MIAVIQRVSQASVSVDEKIVASIDTGYLVLVGINSGDTERDREYIVKKLLNIRLFPSEAKNIDKSIKDINGQLLLVSQFTLYANCTKGNRPSFTDAMPPDQAKFFYEDFVAECKKQYSRVQSGVFGAMMEVSLVNDGPVTIIIDSPQ